MRGVYTANIDISGLSSAKTLILLQASATSVIEILSVHLTNQNNEVNEQWPVGLFHVTTYGSPAGTAITPEKHEKLDASSVATVLGNLTAEPTLYSTNPIDKEGISSLSGYHYDPIPEERPVIPPSGAMGLRLLIVPTATDVSANIVYREIG
jgi:hypothetical protein